MGKMTCGGFMVARELPADYYDAGSTAKDDEPRDNI